MYEFLDSINEPYDSALDLAVLFHDSVYDAHGDKELRSAEWCRNIGTIYSISKSSLDIAYDMILATIDHNVSENNFSAIIRADLHAFTNSKKVIANRQKILQECINLYGVDEHKFCISNNTFLKRLRETQEHNMHSDSTYANFYEQVINGIEQTIMLNNERLKIESI
jgi:predicted metal-dependent HD superfamily phosphohydrolase